MRRAFGSVAVTALALTCHTPTEEPASAGTSVILFDPTVLSVDDTAAAREVVQEAVAWLGDTIPEDGACRQVFTVGPGKLGRPAEDHWCFHAGSYLGQSAVEDALSDIAAFNNRNAEYLLDQWNQAHHPERVRGLESCLLTSLERVDEARREQRNTPPPVTIRFVTDLMEACRETGVTVNLEHDLSVSLPIDSLPHLDLRGLRLSLQPVPHDSLRTTGARRALFSKWADALAVRGLAELPPEIRRFRGPSTNAPDD